MPFLARKAAVDPTSRRNDERREAGLAALRQRLESLEANCLTNLGAGLDAMTRGDLTVAVKPVTSPLEPCGVPAVDALAEVFDRILAKVQAGVEGYNAVRETMRAALGDHSVLEDLDAKMKSIDRNCLASRRVALTSGEAGDAIGEIARAIGDVASGAERQVQMVDAAKRSTEETASSAARRASSPSRASPPPRRRPRRSRPCARRRARSSTR